MLLNFASATKPFGRFVYIMKDLSDYLKVPAKHPLGWLLLDYPFGTSPKANFDVPKQLIVSNYQ